MIYRDRVRLKYLVLCFCLILVLIYLVKKQNDVLDQIPSRGHNVSIATEYTPINSAEVTTELQDRIKVVDAHITAAVKKVTGCMDKPKIHVKRQHGNFWILENYVLATKNYKCEESVTYATTATFYFLDNLVTVVERWQGPVSVAVYAPGSDFLLAMESIAYLRECSEQMIKEMVTFHIFFEIKYILERIVNYEDVIARGVNCSILPPYKSVPKKDSFKEKKEALFMINLARNIAREMSETYFILSADIEQYPSTNLIPLFLEMIAKENRTTQRVVYALQDFQVKKGNDPPLDKSTLRKMVRKGSAGSFHHKLCPDCHDFPKPNEWLKENSEKTYIFTKTKRTGRFKAWEPFFIGTNEDPWYDERVSWEGMKDKRIQGYALCLLDYEFLVSNNLFLVHKPEIKTTEYFGNRKKVSDDTSKLIDEVILPEYQKIYGAKKECSI